MKKIIRMSIIVLAVLMTCTVSSQAERFQGGGRGGSIGHFRGGGRGGSFGHFRGGGRGWGWGPAFGLGLWGLTYPYYGYPYYPYYDQPPVIVQQPSTEMYVQPAPQQSEEPTYWYFCQNPQGYYPYVKQCPSGWMKVVPPSSPPQ